MVSFCGVSVCYQRYWLDGFYYLEGVAMTITLTREEAQQLLEVFELFLEEAEDVTTLENNLVKMLRARLAQPESEPVAWLFQHEETGLTDCIDTQQVEWGFEKNNPRWQKIAPLYTAPPQREWQGLTDEEIAEILDYGKWKHVPQYARNFVDAIEAKLKEKNT